MSSAETLAREDTGLPSPEEFEAMHAAMLAAKKVQPTLALLDSPAAYWDGMEEPGRHLVTLEPDLPGVIDVGQQRFVPDDYATLTELLVPRLTAAFPDALDGGTRPHLANWATLAPIEPADELDGALTLAVRSRPDADGVVYQLDVRIDAGLSATVVQENPIGGNVEAVAAASAQALTETLTQAEAFAEQATAEPEPEPEVPATDAPVVDGDFLAARYGARPIAFEGREYVVDWSTWSLDEVNDEWSGSHLDATDADGTAHRVYVWASPDDVEIALAEPTTPDDAAVAVEDEDEEGLEGVAGLFEEDDLEAEFEQLRTDLSERYGDSHTLSYRDEEYRVVLSDLERDGEDLEFWFVKTTATRLDDSTEVACRLQIRDAEDLAIQSIA